MFQSVEFFLTIIAFFLSMVFILWRPKGLNEAIPATAGAILVLISGSVTLSDLVKISTMVSGAAITIIATISMAIILESFGFYIWAAEGLLAKARGSGIRLFWYVNAVCFLMTLFFNNDGSIFITTPILILLLNHLKLKNHEKIPYLLSGALTATASSAPIGVSNIVNLIALKIIGIDLFTNFLMMFVPSVAGLLLFSGLLYLCFYKKLPRNISNQKFHNEIYPHPSQKSVKERNLLMRNILLFVFSVRVGLFIASYYNIPIEIVAVLGSVLLLGWRWIYIKIPPLDMLKKTPWYIFLFAFSIYIIIFGLNNIGLTSMLIHLTQPLIAGDLLTASLIMGVLLTIMSSLFNNHPALMIGTVSLTSMNLDPLHLKVAYLASVIGSDVGSLLLPIGTLASLIWLHIIRQNNVKISWKDYVKVTIITIPPTVLFTLVFLAYWVKWLF
ncbi:UNVERIFIED_CONTAM: arsenical pump membrane protein [Paenibacillus sp. PvR008]